jgi:hypothetical protein
MHHSDPVRRLCAAVAIYPWPADPDALPDADPDADPRGRPYRRMVEAVKSACLAAGLDQLFLQEYHPAPGEGRAAADAVLLVMLPGMNEARVITDLVHWLDDAVTKAEAAGPSAGEPLRVVIAFDQGITRLTEAGFEGRVVTAVYRLAAEERAHAALRGGSEHRVGVVISASLLDDLAPLPPAPDTPEDRAPNGFEPLSVDLSGRRVAAWSYPSGRRFRFPGQN